MEELAISAKLATEHYSILNCFRDKKYRRVIDKYYGYFYFSINAHKYALVLALSQLYERSRKNTHNIRAFLDYAEKHKMISKECIRKQRRRLSRVESIANEVIKLRHHRYAHKMIPLRESEANVRFAVEDKELKWKSSTFCFSLLVSIEMSIRLWAI